MERFEVYEWACERYMPQVGEGETMASQCVTAVTKLVYKWFNDGDVYDNNYMMDGWGNDLSSYANWLEKYTPAAPILEGIRDCYGDDEYEDILMGLCDLLLTDENLTALAKVAKAGSIYDCDGSYSFTEQDEEEW